MRGCVQLLNHLLVSQILLLAVTNGFVAGSPLYLISSFGISDEGEMGWHCLRVSTETPYGIGHLIKK